MNKSSLLPPLVLALALPVLGAVPVAATENVRPTVVTSRAPDTPTLVNVRAWHRDGTDRVVFRFDGPSPTVEAEYVDELIADGSGKRVRVPGRAILKVRFEPASAHTDSGVATEAPRRRAFALPNVMTVVRSGDFEGVVTYGLGLAKRSRFSVTSSADRVVVHVRASFPTTTQRVWFLDRDNFDNGTEPYFVSRKRPVRLLAPATGVMDRIYAGPIRREYRNGLRLIRSGTTGFEDLEIRAGVARVRLLGTCSSRGSTVTIAGEIMPSLRQFETVDWVKVYDQAGHTENPSGSSDSIPECLEP